MTKIAHSNELTLTDGDLFAGRYLILRLIDRGQSGRVYQAEQVSLKRIVALKILDVASLDAAQLGRHAERFLREASHLGRLSSPNTVRVWDYGVHEGRPYIAMEFVDGESLRRVLDRGRMEPLRALRIARQMCNSLAEAHFLGLIHRDLKPANVLVCSDVRGDDLVKVADFGLVKDTEDAVQMTGEGIMLGTPMYMSPEQIKGGAIDQRSDLYAVGVLLFRVFTGAFPFRETQQAQVLMAHLTNNPLTFAEVDPELSLPPCVEWTVQTCLAKDVKDRFATVEELARALKLCEAALLDPETAAQTVLRLEHGRLILPEAIYGRTVRAPRRSWGPALQWSAIAAAGLGSLFLVVILGAVLVRQILRSQADPGTPVVYAPEVPLPAPLPVVQAPAPPPVEPEPTVAVAQPEPEVQPAPPPRPDPAPALPKPAAPKPAAPKPEPTQPRPAPQPPTAAPVPPSVGSDLVDPWSSR